MRTPQQKYEVTKQIAAICLDLNRANGTPVRLFASPSDPSIPSVAGSLARGGNTTAKEDVANLYGRAIIELRKQDVAVVPVTEFFLSLVAKGITPTSEEEIAASIAGLAGHGSKTVALHFPSDEDDLIYIASLIGRMNSGAGKVKATGTEIKRANGKHLLSAGEAHAALAHQPKRTQIAALPPKV